MSSFSPKRLTRLLRAAVKRRPRRGSWVYLPWLLAYLPLMIFTAGDLSLQVRPHQLLPLLIPLAVVLGQLAYPTLLGWSVIAIPSVFVAGTGVVSVVLTAPARVQQDQLRALTISSVAAGVYVLVCVGLWFGRPKLADAVLAEPNASPNAGSAGPPAESVD